MKLILASASPRRKELLKKITTSFDIEVADVDERILDLPPKDLAAEESKLKAYAVYSLHPDCAILACDTIVVLDNKVLGKPTSREDAFRMLKEEQGKEQIVLSGYTFINKDVEITRTVKTHVFFNALTDVKINDYIDRFKPFDKAGSYGIQDDYPLISHIEGSFDNVMGLPVEDIKKRVGHLLAK